MQAAFDELGTPLREVTFVVVDLETTGGSAAADEITEIGAVKVRGGAVIGELQTLVKPRMAIPAFISVLTGITDRMVADAPRPSVAVAAFLDWVGAPVDLLGGHGTTVLVAHNAPFDIGFLKAACAEQQREWPGYPVLDTALLARRVLTRDETANCKLATLAAYFRASTTPEHRALADARATVDVLHGLLERLGPLGVQSWEELAGYSGRVAPETRRKRHLAEGLTEGPGVYMFCDSTGRPLYIGTSATVRSRVRQYFTASELRSRMTQMVRLAESVSVVPCETVIEAQVREVRLIAEHKPRYNRRSTHPERATWVKLTKETFPRLSLVRQVTDDGCAYLGPFGSRAGAEDAVAALHDTFPLRQCTARLSVRRPIPACALAGMGRCNAPCQGAESPEQYSVHVQAARESFRRDARPVVAALEERVSRLAGQECFEEAARSRDRLTAFLTAAARLERLSSLAGLRQLVAAAPIRGGWEVVVVRHGRLAGSTVVPPGAAPQPYVDAAVAAAESITPGAGPLAAASAEELRLLLGWLTRPGVRLVEVEGTWASPVHGAAGHAASWDPTTWHPRALDPVADHRGIRPATRSA